MRDVYYQAVGNPIQRDRLPPSQPTIEFLPPALHWIDTLRMLLIAAGVMVAAAVLALILGGQPVFAWLSPIDAIFCTAVLAVACVQSLRSQSLSPLLHPLCQAAVIVSCFAFHTEPIPQTLLTAAYFAVLVQAYGRHAIVLATVSPLPREVAEQVRKTARQQLLGFGIVLAVLVAAWLFFRQPVVLLALATLPIAAMAMPAPLGLRANRFHLVWRALCSWLTHTPRDLPGLVQSPAGGVWSRISLLAVATMLTAIAIHNGTTPVDGSAESWRLLLGVFSAMFPREGESVAWGYALLRLLSNFIVVVGPPVVAVVLAVSACAMPVILEGAAAREQASAAADSNSSLLSDLRRSSDRTERYSLLHGHVVQDGSPVLIPRDVHLEHCHALGDSGGGKTSLFLCPTMEQLGSFGDCSIVMLDLKADSLETFGALQAAATTVQRRLGRTVPVKWFSNQRTRTTFAFNPMTQPFWRNFDLLTRTDILCAANGLTYGTDYGAGYFSSANAAILYHTIKTYPGANTFSELAEAIGTVITVAKKRDLHPEIRKAGVHVHEVIKRLAACEALNVTDSSGHSAATVEQAIDLAELFREPQFLYCHLPSTLSPSGAPEIARLFTYMLLAASTQTERRCPVFLVIDEFQRMVANNLEYMLQLARSMGVGVIIANQSMQDLRRGNIDLIPAIEANCRLRQWYSVSSAEDQERLIRSSGVTVDTLASRSNSVNAEGKHSTSYTVTEQVVPRLTVNDILLTNDHPFRSILRVSRGAGYAQFGGMPVIVESRFHISKQEYERRKLLPWPQSPGAFQPHALDAAQQSATPSTATQPSFSWTEEVLGDKAAKPLGSEAEIDLKQLFESLQQQPKQPTPRNRKKKS